MAEDPRDQQFDRPGPACQQYQCQDQHDVIDASGQMSKGSFDVLEYNRRQLLLMERGDGKRW
jgi:hypothetical protein